MLFIIKKTLSVVKHSLQWFKKILEIVSKKQQHIKPFLFYILFMINFFTLSRYHNIFVYNAIEYSGNNLITLFSPSYIKFFLIF